MQMFLRQFPYYIAEIAQAHEGSLGILHSYIDAVAKTGAHAIKFQLHIAEAESSEAETFRTKFSYEDATRFDYWKRMEFTFEQWQGIKAHVEAAGLDFIVSPFSVAAVKMLEKLGLKAYKIGSGELSNLLMLEAIAKTGTPVILSSGMSDFTELDTAVSLFKSRNTPLALLQCTTAYPTKPTEYGFNVLAEMKSRYQIPIGFSDHSAKSSTGIAAVALGAEILEFHVVFDKELFGPDARASLTFPEVKQLIAGANDVYEALQNPVVKNHTADFNSLKTLFGKSLAVNRDLEQGAVLQESDLESKKPANCGIPAADYKQVIGKKLLRPLKQWDFLTENDIA
ncbi:N-acetylneuraminate synthase family protein [Flavobacterium sp.]|uniref:N-acetylneuraminate synthase family protein n=1 Tax=Flavobacterium sp. TaxID=239 RepID=UPI003B993EA3